MWRKLILIFVILPLAVLLIALAVVNREPVKLILDPFGASDPWLTLTAPLFFLLLGAFAFGLVAGGLATWLNQGKWRKRARSESRDARDFRRQVERLEKELEVNEPATAHAQLPAD